jgi:hypothetical protein
MTNPTPKTLKPHTDSATERQSADAPSSQLHDDRESPRAERALKRRLRRDAGPDAAHAAADPGIQARPKMAMNAPTLHEEVQGILVQTRMDHPRAGRRRLREVLQERLCQAGIDMPADEVDSFVQAVPTDDEAN